jgi:nucleoside 2-deoxyribosyltransferase
MMGLNKIGGGRVQTTVYLAGKMAGLTPEEMSGWRSIAAGLLPESGGFSILNPVDVRLSRATSPREIVDSNKYQIRNSDLVLAELDHGDVSLGTIGEIVFAREVGKPVIAWGTAYDIINHPWVQEHITIHFHRLTDALDYILFNYKKAS